MCISILLRRHFFFFDIHTLNFIGFSRSKRSIAFMTYITYLKFICFSRARHLLIMVLLRFFFYQEWPKNHLHYYMMYRKIEWEVLLQTLLLHRNRVTNFSPFNLLAFPFECTYSKLVTQQWGLKMLYMYTIRNKSVSRY